MMRPKGKPPEDQVGQITPEGYLVGQQTILDLGGGDAQEGRRRLRLAIADSREQKPITGPADRPANVRVATERDEHAVLRLLLQEIREHGETVAPADPAKLCGDIEFGTRRKGGVTAVIDGPGGDPIAVSVIIPNQWAWSNQWHLCERYLFVVPAWRSRRYATDLIQFGCWWADRMTEKFGYRIYLISGVLTTSLVREKIRLYRRHASLVGATFCYPTPQ